MCLLLVLLPQVAKEQLILFNDSICWVNNPPTYIISVDWMLKSVVSNQMPIWEVSKLIF